MANYLKLPDLTVEYWKYVGTYAGDFLIRFWWREDFHTTFQYETVRACYSDIEDCEDE